MKCRILQQWEAKALGATHVDSDGDYLSYKGNTWFYLKMLNTEELVWVALIGDFRYFTDSVREL